MFSFRRQTLKSLRASHALQCMKVKVTWYTAKYGDPYSEFVLCIYPSKCTDTEQWTHTHTHHEHTPGAVVSHFYAAAPRKLLGVRCLAQGHLSRGIESGESTVHSLPSPTILAGPRLELATCWLRVQHKLILIKAHKSHSDSELSKH